MNHNAVHIGIRSHFNFETLSLHSEVPFERLKRPSIREASKFWSLKRTINCEKDVVDRCRKAALVGGAFEREDLPFSREYEREEILKEEKISEGENMKEENFGRRM